MIKRKKIRVWQGNPELYKQYSKIDYFATEDEVTKGFAFYQRNSNGELVFKGSSSKFDFQKEMKEMVPNIRPVRIDAYTGDFNEFKPGKGRLYISGDGTVMTENQPRKFCYVYHDSTGTIEKVEISKDMTSRNFVGVASPGTIYGVGLMNIVPVLQLQRLVLQKRTKCIMCMRFLYQTLQKLYMEKISLIQFGQIQRTTCSVILKYSFKEYSGMNYLFLNQSTR